MFLLVLALLLPGLHALIYREAIPVPLSPSDDADLPSNSNQSVNPYGSLLRCDYL